MLLGYLHGDWEVVRSFGWEVDIDCFLNEGGIRSSMIDFHDMQLEHPAVRKAQSSNIWKRTLAPVAVRTANVNSLVGF
jgi:hypothetical protein